MKHVSGNLLSRWTDFLTSDGEKPWRNRDDEFVDSFASRQELMEYWQKGWACLAEALDSLRPADLNASRLDPRGALVGAAGDIEVALTLRLPCRTNRPH